MRQEGDVDASHLGWRSRLATLLGVGGVVFCADQVTKSLAVSHLANHSVHVIGPISFELAFNSGVAFSLFSGFGLPIIVITAALIVLLVWFTRGMPSYPVAVGVGMILGGAFGNLCDRVFRGNGGEVVDFIHTGFWPTFNVADSSVVCGCALLIVLSFRRGALRPSKAHNGEKSDAP